LFYRVNKKRRDETKIFYDCRSMALSDPIPVRFSSQADANLGRVSAASGLSKAELIRIAVDSFLIKTQETGEIIQRHVLQEVSGSYATGNQTNNFTSAPDVPAPGPTSYAKKSRAKKKPEK
jgi:hypothetical protein